MVPEKKNIVKLLANAIDSGIPVAFCTVIAVGGSTPRETGAKMLVYSDGKIEGTVGGGKVESMVIKQAVQCISENKPGKYDFSLHADGNTGMICNGDLEVFIDVYKKPFKVLILGAGHVAIKIAQACELAGYPYIVADDREEFANREKFPGAMKIMTVQPDHAVAQAGVDRETYIVIVTRGHSLDNECLVEALKTDAPYIGMIGSRSKVNAIFHKMAEKAEAARKEGKSEPDPLSDKRVYSPIGLDLGGKTPGEIAISVIAEITKLFNSRTGKHLRIEE